MIVGLTIWIVIGNFFFYKIGKEDEEELTVVDRKTMEVTQHIQISEINTPKLKPYTPRIPPVPISAYEKSRQIMLRKQK